MTQTTRKLEVKAPFLLLPLLSLAVAAGCSSTPGAPGGTGGLGNGSGGNSAGVGGASAGSGGVASGGAGTGGAASGGASAGSGGSNPGTGGAASGGTSGGSGGTTGGSGGSGPTGPVFHVFMLMGQSNMAGVAERQPSDANTDERLKVWGGCGNTPGQWNMATNPPLNDCPGEKGWNTDNAVDPGIVFGKALLEVLPEGHTIGLVPTAESGESINTFISGGSHHQMILTKIAGAKQADNARFAGVIFHQGESDNMAPDWPGKVVQLYDEVKAAWGADYDVPFILGELPNGGCCSGHNTRVHEAAELLPDGYWITQDGTGVLPDGLHFDHASVLLMGERYAETMIEALGW